jgi:hypothetical protein
MLLRFKGNVVDPQIVEVDLNTLEITPRTTLPGNLIDWSYRGRNVSPDFKHLAVMVPPSRQAPPKNPTNYTRWRLRLLDLETMLASDLDTDVGVDVPVWQSAYGTPPFAWTNSRTILYQHMLADETHAGTKPGDPGSGVYVLKTIDIQSHQVIERFRTRSPLTHNGGNIWVNDLNGDIAYTIINGFFHLDKPPTLRSDLMPPGESPQSRQWAAGRLYDDSVLSPSHRSYAFVPDARTIGEKVLYAMVNNSGRWVAVAESSADWGLRPAVWIEDTHSLRTRKAGQKPFAGKGN